jgi:hypothetical protein
MMGRILFAATRQVHALSEDRGCSHADLVADPGKAFVPAEDGEDVEYAR